MRNAPNNDRTAHGADDVAEAWSEWAHDYELDEQLERTRARLEFPKVEQPDTPLIRCARIILNNGVKLQFHASAKLLRNRH